MESVSSGLKAGKERPATDIVFATEYPRSSEGRSTYYKVWSQAEVVLFSQGHAGRSDNVRSADPFRWNTFNPRGPCQLLLYRFFCPPVAQQQNILAFMMVPFLQIVVANHILKTVVPKNIVVDDFLQILQVVFPKKISGKIRKYLSRTTFLKLCKFF